MNVEIKNIDIHGLQIRELRLPRRHYSSYKTEKLIINYTRFDDVLTIVGNQESLEAIKINFEDNIFNKFINKTKYQNNG